MKAEAVCDLDGNLVSVPGNRYPRTIGREGIKFLVVRLGFKDPGVLKT